MRETNWFRGVGLFLAVALMAFAGCASQQHEASEPQTQASEPANNGIFSPRYAPYADSSRVTGGVERSDEKQNFNSLRYPDGISGSPAILEKIMPAKVNAGQEFEYQIKVYNTADFDLRDVVVTENLPTGMKVTGTEPKAAIAGGKATWKMDSLAAKETSVLLVKGTANDVGTLKSCATVVFTPYVCASTVVVKPALEITKTMPEEVLLCDEIPVHYVVSNPGTGALSNVTVEDKLPAGLVTNAGRDAISFTIDSLAPGEKRAFKAGLKATKTGKYTNTATAAAGSLSAKDSATVTVRQPVLAITKTGPDRTFLGRDVTYTITVTNNGDAPSAQTTLTDTLDGQATFVGASDGVQAVNGKVTWPVGTLAPKASKKYTVTVRPSGISTITNTARVSGVCAAEVAAAASTKIEGIPAILLEVIDVEDPIEVGSNVTYVITATNQGTAVGTNIKIVAGLEASMEFVSAEGATNATHAKGTVTFQALPTLAPKAKATWRVTVKAVKEADARFKVSMNSDQIGRSVDETEATNFFK